MANSYLHINAIGYFYISNNKNSTINFWRNPKKRNEIVNSFLLNVQFLYEKTKNSYLDKLYCIFKIKHYFNNYK